MGLLDLILHLLNFVAPALAVGGLLALVAPLVYANKASGYSLSAQAAINFVAGLLALLAGLLVFGHDGKMLTYAAMVLACALSQWWALRR